VIGECASFEVQDSDSDLDFMHGNPSPNDISARVETNSKQGRQHEFTQGSCSLRLQTTMEDMTATTKNGSCTSHTERTAREGQRRGDGASAKSRKMKSGRR
jgi:hypothetical protein